MGSSPTGNRDFFFFSVCAHFLANAIAQKVLFGIFIRALQLTTFKPLYMLNSAQRPNLTGKLAQKVSQTLSVAETEYNHTPNSKAWSEHGVEALWTGRIFFCPVHNASTPCSLQAFGIRCMKTRTPAKLY